MLARVAVMLGSAVVWFWFGYYVGKDAKECPQVIKIVKEPVNCHFNGNWLKGSCRRKI